MFTYLTSLGKVNKDIHGVKETVIVDGVTVEKNGVSVSAEDSINKKLGTMFIDVNDLLKKMEMKKISKPESNSVIDQEHSMIKKIETYSLDVTFEKINTPLIIFPRKGLNLDNQGYIIEFEFSSRLFTDMSKEPFEPRDKSETVFVSGKMYGKIVNDSIIMESFSLSTDLKDFDTGTKTDLFQNIICPLQIKGKLVY